MVLDERPCVAWWSGWNHVHAQASLGEPIGEGTVASTSRTGLGLSLVAGDHYFFPGGSSVSGHGSTDRKWAGAPARFADPRRIGTLVGLFGAYVFVFSYTPGFADLLRVGVRALVICAIIATVWFLFASPRYLGPFTAPRGRQIGIYLLCVLMEFALIAFGTGRLTSIGKLELQPALIALVVGLHLIPFAWAFKEGMFYILGGVLAGLGGLGLLIGTQSSALGAAVGSGLVMSLILLAYSLGMFASLQRDMNQRKLPLSRLDS